MVRHRSAVLLCALFGFAAPLHAGSTTSLHTPQGGGAITANGDFVTSDGTTAGGSAAMNTTYRYFVEVPAGLTSLQIQIYDADIGDGTNEDVAGRDRDRGGYDTIATYSLFNPAGAAVTPRFTTGNTTTPANADANWLTFYGVGNSVLDQFTTAAFTNNDGTADWAGNWIETDSGAGAGAGAGAVRIVGGRLQMQDGVTVTPAMARQVDLVGVNGLDLTAAFLTYDYSNQNAEGDDVIQVQASSNGGTSYTTIVTYTGPVSGTANINISAYIANNTRIRFLLNGGYDNANELFFVDNVQISDGAAAPAAGHWEVRIAQPDTAGDRDDINAIGIRAHDGDFTAGGTELNVYADSYLSLGVNPDGNGGATRNYVLYPWITAGCTSSQNDFDRDTNQGAIGSIMYTSRIGTFSQTITDAMLSNDDQWNREDIINYTSNFISSDYGIWRANSTITTYDNGTGNYETYYAGNYLAPANPPTGTLTQPLTGGGFPAAYRIYMPTDGGGAPVKPYLEQFLTAKGPQPPPALTVAKTYTVAVRVVNPTPHAITFSATNLVVANVPGNGTVYAGNFSASQGQIVSEPGFGSAGDVIWNPSTTISVAANDSATMSYDVTITPAIAVTPATGVPSATGTDNGTRATYVDETGNTTQARSTYRLGGICNLNVVVGLATEVMLSAFEVDDRGRVSWTTASEAGTVGFNLYREDGTKVNENLIPAGKHHYEIDDRYVAERYLLDEVTASGKVNRHGPLVTGRRLGPDVPEPADEPMRRAILSEATASIVADGAKADAAKAAKAVAVMAGVRETGVVRVPFTELATRLGKTVASIERSASKGDVSVKTGGQAVAWTPTADALLFFGEKSDSIYSNARIYRIELDRGEPMTNVPVASSSVVLSTFAGQVDIETDSWPVSVLPVDPEGDYCFWDYVVSGDPTDGRKTFVLQVPGMASASGATLEVRLQGALNGASHTARVQLNGVPVGEMSWTDLNARTSTLVLPAGVLRDGSNQVEIEGVLAPSAPFDVFFIDGFTVRYSRFAQPVNGAIEASLSNAITAGPFTAAPIALDITKRLRPTLLTGGSFTSGNLSSTLPSSTKTVFVSERFVTPTSYRASYEPFLRSQRPDYIVVAPASMRSGAEALASLRQSDGLRTLVADLEQIYDEFSNGNATPHAIRAYLVAAMKTSQRPRYVVLAGTGTLDYRGLEQSPGPVPPMMIKTNDGLFASDSKFADTNNDGVPDLAIGRIPVSNNAELLAYIDKLRYHTASATTDPIVFTADATDQQTNFGQASDESSRPMEGLPRTRLHVDQIGPQAARTGLIDVWKSGTPLVSWIGHGGLDQLASSGILTAGDAPALLAPGRLPILVAMTCTINRFELGIYESLGSALTRQAGGGALAVWSATGISNHEDARALQRTFMKLAAQKPQLKVGELIVLTLAAHPSDTAGIYVLLGDPAIALNLPKEIANSAPASPTGE